MGPKLAMILGTMGVLLLAGVAVAAATTEIGGPPSSDIDRCLKPLRPCSDPIVIGTGHHFNGPSEIVAFDSRAGLCVDVDRRRHSFGSCGTETLPRHGAAIEVTGYGFTRDGQTTSEIVGPLRPDVASVRVRYRREEERKEAMATVAQVDGKLLSALKQKRPFGFFEVPVRGCIQAKRFRAAAIDDAGNVIGRSRAPDFPDFCERGGAGGFSIAITGRR